MDKPTEKDWHEYDRLADKMERCAQEAGRTWTDIVDLTEKERRFYRRIYRWCVKTDERGQYEHWLETRPGYEY